MPAEDRIKSRMIRIPCESVEEFRIRKVIFVRPERIAQVKNWTGAKPIHDRLRA
jgi:hypothetical protein